MNGLALPAADGGLDPAGGGVAPAPHGATPWCGALTRLEVVLVRPAKYDDDGYVLRHRWGVLPSNTLACLASLTEDVERRGALRPLRLRTHTFDESVERLPMRRLRRLARRADTKVVVCLVGVQTSQFPRAADLALRLRGLGIDVLIGGFHVSGLLTHSSALPAHLRELADAGVILVRGEVEDVWQDILGHVVAGTMPAIYDRGAVTPDLRTAPVPRLAARALRRFAFRHFGTVDTSRGCPFTCSFCAIIAVQGQAMRARDAGAIAGAIAASHTATGTRHYFLTDDDFARNREWRRVFEALIRLREARGIGVRFLMQVDALAHRTPDFVALAQAAGCFQVFIGLESLNPRNLAAASKRQNRVGDFAATIAAWRAAGILTHAGYIIGFADDTADSVGDDVAALRDDVRPDVASFFMLTPLAGSADYAKLLGSGAVLDDDLNRHDTFHPVLDHPRMSRAAWYAAYRQAWATFYTDDVMRQRLRDARGEQHITLLQIYFWYLASTRGRGLPSDDDRLPAPEAARRPPAGRAGRRAPAPRAAAHRRAAPPARRIRTDRPPPAAPVVRDTQRRDRQQRAARSRHLLARHARPHLKVES